MKKYLAIFAVLFTVILSSCSNDDIPVGQSVTFKINPQTVVSSLLESTPGDLTSISSNENLYINLFVYNDAGILVSKDEQKFNDYTHIMNSILNIKEGVYTIVVATQIKRDSGFKYWDITGIDNISTLKITDEGYIGGSSKILGLTAKKISVTAGTKEVSIDVECAGAVALVNVFNWNRYSNVKEFGLVSNKSCDDVTLDYSGGLNYSIETSTNYKYRMALFMYDSKYSGATGYSFMFPFTNINMSFYATTTDDKIVLLGEPCGSSNILKGHTYWFAYDVESEDTYWADATDWDLYSSKAPKMQTATTAVDGMLKYNTEDKTITIIQ